MTFQNCSRFADDGAIIPSMEEPEVASSNDGVVALIVILSLLGIVGAGKAAA